MLPTNEPLIRFFGRTADRASISKLGRLWWTFAYIHSYEHIIFLLSDKSNSVSGSDHMAESSVSFYGISRVGARGDALRGRGLGRMEMAMKKE